METWSERLHKVIFYSPGNGGTENNIPIDYSNFDKIIKFAAENNCDTIVGPEIHWQKGLWMNS